MRVDTSSVMRFSSKGEEGKKGIFGFLLKVICLQEDKGLLKQGETAISFCR